MDLTEAIQLAERLEREDCIGTTSLALRTLLKAFKELTDPSKVAISKEDYDWYQVLKSNHDC